MPRASAFDFIPCGYLPHEDDLTYSHVSEKFLTETFYYYDPLQIVICRPCRRVIVDKTLRAHLEKNYERHRLDNTDAEYQGILRYFQRFPQRIRQINHLKIPSEPIPAIPILPIDEETFQCDQSNCRWIGGNTTRAQEHSYRVHKRSFRHYPIEPGRRPPWKKVISQRFVSNGICSQRFVVLPPQDASQDDRCQRPDAAVYNALPSLPPIQGLMQLLENTDNLQSSEPPYQTPSLDPVCQPDTSKIVHGSPKEQEDSFQAFEEQMASRLDSLKAQMGSLQDLQNQMASHLDSLQKQIDSLQPLKEHMNSLPVSLQVSVQDSIRKYNKEQIESLQPLKEKMKSLQALKEQIDSLQQFLQTLQEQIHSIQPLKEQIESLQPLKEQIESFLVSLEDPV